MEITGCNGKLLMAMDVNCYVCYGKHWLLWKANVCYEKSIVGMEITGDYGESIVAMEATNLVEIY
jgi:hypothetical protein